MAYPHKRSPISYTGRAQDSKSMPAKDRFIPLDHATNSPRFSAHVYCDQTAGWMKTPLGTEVDLGPGYIVLTGTQLPSRKGHTSSPLFRPCLLWPRPPISATAELLFKIAAIRHLGFLETGFFNCGYTSECHYASSCKILWQSVQLFLRYGDFSISQNGGRPPSGICCEHV